MLRTVAVPDFLDVDPARDLGKSWGCTGIPASPNAAIPYALALMDVVDKTAQKWMQDRNLRISESRRYGVLERTAPILEMRGKPTIAPAP